MCVNCKINEYINRTIGLSNDQQINMKKEISPKSIEKRSKSNIFQNE